MGSLSLENVSKTFHGRLVLDGVDLEVRPGEVHGLIGQNGCGKSTLIKILSGYHVPDHGAQARVGGRPVTLGDAQAAHAAGLRFIHQDLGLVGELSAVDNLALGGTYTGRWWLSDRRERAAARALLARYDVDIDVDIPVNRLSPARQTFVAVVRALGTGLAKDSVLVLDEPTAALPEDEVQHLFGLLRGLREHGVATVLVTHRLKEILDIADRVTVLRDGRVVATTAVDTLDHDSLAELVIGRSLPGPREESPAALANAADGAVPVLSVEHLRGAAVVDATFRVAAGEVLGVAGVVGGGYDDVLSLVFGARRQRSGTVHLHGRTCPNDPASSVLAGLAYAPADRKRLAAIPEWSLRENVTLPAISSQRLGWLGQRTERGDVRTWLRRLRVAAAPEQGFRTLSGGNQQRVVLAKWLRREATVLLIDEPSSGVDVGAREAIYTAIAEAARTGTSFVLASSDAEELAAVCDRVLVFREGVVRAELHGPTLTVDNIVGESLRPHQLEVSA